LRICIVSPEQESAGGIGQSRRRYATLLASRHEVTLIQSGGLEGRRATTPDLRVREVFAKPSARLVESSFCLDHHRASAAVLEAIERAYGSVGPDYVEVPDFGAHGLVPLHARRAGHPLLRDTMFGVQLCSSDELLSLHDRTSDRPGKRMLADLEREQLRLADRITWRGGDILNVYRRYYPFELPEAVCIGAPFERPGAPPDASAHDTGRPLRILSVARLQRFKGVIDLAEACLRLPRDDWELTMIGDDTDTGPAGQSVRLTIEEMFGDDPRLTIEDSIDHGELQRRWADYDLLVVASRFEVSSNVSMEAMRAGLPILATPVGSAIAQVDPRVTGWHTEDVGARAIERALRELLDDRDEIERVRCSGDIFERFLALSDPEQVLEGYERLFRELGPLRRGNSSRVRKEEPLVTGVVTHFRASAYVEEAVESLLGQTHRNLEVLIVNDGSFEQADDVLERLAGEPRVRVVTQLNEGESEARNLGARLARGDYVAMLDADNVLEPEFVSRAVEMLQGDPDLAYVSCWLRFVAADGADTSEPTAGYAPLGNGVLRDDEYNWDGDTVAVLPTRIFTELGYGFEPEGAIQSDWELYRWLREDGRLGAVIPDWLVRYRIVADSLSRTHGDGIQRRSWEEARARRQLRSIHWTAEV
jgi:glycogen synthase